MNRKERSFDRPYTVRRSDCSGDARPGSFLESPWLSCPKSASSGKALRSERVASCLCTCAHDSRQVALVSRGASPQSPLSSNLGFRADPELGPESPATSDGGDIWGSDLGESNWSLGKRGDLLVRDKQAINSGANSPSARPADNRSSTPPGPAASLPPTSQAARPAIHFQAQARLQGHFQTARSRSVHFLKHRSSPMRDCWSQSVARQHSKCSGYSGEVVGRAPAPFIAPILHSSFLAVRPWAKASVFPLAK